MTPRMIQIIGELQKASHSANTAANLLLQEVGDLLAANADLAKQVEGLEKDQEHYLRDD